MPVDPVDEDGQPGVHPRVLGLAAADAKADDTDLGPLAVLVLNRDFGSKPGFKTLEQSVITL